MMFNLFRRGVRVAAVSAAALMWSGAPALAANAPAQPTQKSESKQIVVGFSQVGSESAWRTAETKSIKEEAQKRGIELKFADAQQKQASQISTLRSFIAQKVDAIILAPVVETGWEPVLREAKEAHIPVILVDRGVTVSDPSLYATKIASDFVEEGKMAAEWLASKTGGKANIVELAGTTGAAPAVDRAKGFREVTKTHPEMKIIKTQSANFERAKGKEVMQSIIKADKGKFNAVYAHNDDMALGAIQALEEAGLKPGKDVLVISIDGIHDAFQSIADGKLGATVECNPILGPAAFDAVQKVLAGKPVDKFIKSHDALFDSGNAAAALPNRQY